MTIDRNLVTKEFKHYIWPLCKVHGFSKINGRTIWRFREGAVDVINLQGDRWNEAGGPHRFFINLGIYLTGIERAWTRHERGHPVPTESDCDLRRALRQVIPDGSWGGDWTIEANGVNVEDVYKSVQAALEHNGFPWFQKFWDAEATLRYMMETEADGEVGLGRLDSPHRNWLVGLYALSLGRWEIAERYLALAEPEYAASPGEPQSELYTMIAGGLTRAREAKNAAV